VFRAFAGWRASWLGADLLAGLTLAAIAVPEQMATARLAGLSPSVGLLSFLAGSIAFAVAGSSRTLSAGADSTIAPIFAGGLATLAATGSVHYGALAVGLALLVGAVVATAGVARLGFVGDLLSAPVMTGFLAGIAVHILASQAPAALGLPVPAGATLAKLLRLAAEAWRANPWDVGVAAGVVAVTAACEKLAPRLPGALIGVAAATAFALILRLEPATLAPLGEVAGALPRLGLPDLTPRDWIDLAPLALLVGAVVMVQTATVSRAFPVEGEAPQVARDFIGLGAGNLLAGLAGAFPVDASPPRTAIVRESGARSQVAGLAAAAMLALLLAFGARLLAVIPVAALAGVLLFVATRLVRLGEMRLILQRSPAEFALVVATIGAIVILPIEWGVAAGVALSILHGVWSGARVRVLPMSRLAGSTVWWPDAGHGSGKIAERLDAVQVLTFPAPLTFLVAEGFAREFLAAVDPGAGKTRLAILEAAGMVMIDFTAAQALTRVVNACRTAGCDFALARLESPAAQAALARLGLTSIIGEDHIFDSVAAALDALAPHARAVEAHPAPSGATL
jgi:MFS superfamily sulfate permease-like transporter